MDVASQLLSISPTEGEHVRIGPGLGVVFKIEGHETGGAFAVVEHPIEPRALVIPHVHEREDEFSYVLEGEIGARIGEQELIAGPGAYVLKPRGDRSRVHDRRWRRCVSQMPAAVGPTNACRPDCIAGNRIELARS